MTSDKRDNWKEQALQQYQVLLDKLEAELPKDASLARIERALLEHEQAFLSDTFQLLADRQELSPPNK